MIILKALKDLRFLKNILHKELPETMLPVLFVNHFSLQRYRLLLHGLLIGVSACEAFQQLQQQWRDSWHVHLRYPQHCILSTVRYNQWAWYHRIWRLYRVHPPQRREYGLSWVRREKASILFCSILYRCFMFSISLHIVPLLTRKVMQLQISILESHADLVDSHFDYGGSEDSLNLVRALICLLPSYCVMDEKGQPVLSDELCQLRMAYHPTRVQTVRLQPGANSGCDPQDDLYGYAQLHAHQTAEADRY